MKNILFGMILTLLAINQAGGQTIFSNGTGGGAWSAGTTWIGGQVPTANSDVVIAGTDSVYTAAGSVCANLSVLSGGKLATGVDSIQCPGTFTLEADAWFYNAMTRGTLPGTTREIDAASNVEHSGSGTVGGSGNLEFGNLIIKRTAGTVPGGNLLIKGNLVINNNAAGTVFRGVRPTPGSAAHTVMGDVIINIGTFSGIDVGDNSLYCIWNINGNLRLSGADARFAAFSSANAAGLSIFNIDGDIINNGGRISPGTSSSAGLGTAIINLKGNFTFNSGVFATNHLGPFSINFVGGRVQNFYQRGANLNLNTNLYDTIAAGTTLVMDLDTNKWGSSTGGDVVVNGKLEMKNISRLTGIGNFSLNPGATLLIGSADGITASSMLGSVQMTGTRTYSPEASFVYSGTGAQVFGDGLPLTLKGLIIKNPDGMLLENNMTVTGTLATTNGDLDLNGKTITLGEDAVLSETAGNTVKGATGKIQITKNIGTPTGINAGNLGFMLTSAQSFGTTGVERVHAAATGGGNSGILRVYKISSIHALMPLGTIRLYYDESELNGISENNLQIFLSQSGTDGSWSNAGGTLNAAENYVEQSNVNNYMYATLGNGNVVMPAENGTEELPKDFALSANYPNPFNPSTMISFALPRAQHVNISVYNLLGEKVAELVNKEIHSGYHSVLFAGDDLPTGVYVYRMAAGEYSFSRKMNLLK